MNLSLDQLRQLDPKDVGNWPVPVQLLTLIAVFVLVVLLGGFATWSGLYDELSAGQQEELTSKEAFLDKKRKAVNLDAYKQQLFEIQQAFGALLKQLPSKAEMETLLTEINQSGVGRGLRFELFKPAPKETKTAEFAELPIELTIIGTYHDLAAFASDVSQLSRIVTLENMRLAAAASRPNAGKNDKPELVLNVIAKTYRALDSEETVAMKKAKAEKK